MGKKYVAVDKEKLDNALVKILEYATGEKKSLKLSKSEAKIISAAVIYAIKMCSQNDIDEDAEILGVVK
jgi:hypothetical protein